MRELWRFGVIALTTACWCMLFYFAGVRQGRRQGYRAGYEVGSSEAWRTCAASVLRWRSDPNPLIKPH